MYRFCLIKIYLSLAIVFVVWIFLGCENRQWQIKSVYNRPTTLKEYDTLCKEVYKEPIGPISDYIEYSGRVKAGETLSVVLLRAGIEYRLAEQILLGLKGVMDFRKCKPGDEFIISVSRNTGDLISFEYSSSPLDTYVMERDGDGRFIAYKEEYEIEKRVEFIRGRIQNSLYETMERIGEDPELSIIMANEVFAWDIDFYTEVMPDDEFGVVVEKYYSGDYFVKYGKILAATYNGKSTGKKEAFYFAVGKRGSYYNSKGVASRRVFLRSPLKYGKISSGFGKRFHPIYKKIKMHHGVDYAAPLGTPVWAVADGVVSYASTRGGYGKLVILKHRGGLETRYGHLSRFAAGIKVGTPVEQGRVIGYVGSTGVSTGPHLHFEMRLNGKVINPLKKVSPPVEPLDRKYLREFEQIVAKYKRYLELAESKVLYTESPEMGDED